MDFGEWVCYGIYNVHTEIIDLPIRTQFVWDKRTVVRRACIRAFYINIEEKTSVGTNEQMNICSLTTTTTTTLVSFAVCVSVLFLSACKIGSYIYKYYAIVFALVSFTCTKCVHCQCIGGQHLHTQNKCEESGSLVRFPSLSHIAVCLCVCLPMPVPVHACIFVCRFVFSCFFFDLLLFCVCCCFDAIIIVLVVLLRLALPTSRETEKSTKKIDCVNSNLWWDFIFDDCKREQKNNQTSKNWLKKVLDLETTTTRKIRVLVLSGCILCVCARITITIDENINVHSRIQMLCSSNPCLKYLHTLQKRWRKVLI